MIHLSLDNIPTDIPGVPRFKEDFDVLVNGVSLETMAMKQGEYHDTGFRQFMFQTGKPARLIVATDSVAYKLLTELLGYPVMLKTFARRNLAKYPVRASPEMEGFLTMTPAGVAHLAVFHLQDEKDVTWKGVKR